MVDMHFVNLTDELCNQIFEIERDCIQEPWSLEQIQKLALDKKAVARVGVIGGEAVCYYSFYNICDEGYINNLAVRKDFRGIGLGNLLLEDMIKRAKDEEIGALTLEVNANNSVAIRLYKKFGFIEEGKRAKFYNSTDDALIMWKRDI